MTNPDNERLVNFLVAQNRPGRRFTWSDDTRWGGLLTPGPLDNPGKCTAGLRVVLFASWDFGYLALETMKKFENANPGRLNLVGLVTDDPLNPDARISVRKRVWNLLDIPERVLNETFIIESALSHGTPVYTGEIKIDSFREQLRAWQPDAIVVCVFGQIIDSIIRDLPGFGIYNFHPSDLSRHLGAGPSPFTDLAERGAETTVWSIHHVSEEVDCGRVVGQSPDICVHDSHGRLPNDPLTVYRKLADALSPMVWILAEELSARCDARVAGSIDELDIRSRIPDAWRERFLRPVSSDPWTDVVAAADGLLFERGEDESVREKRTDS